MRTALKGMVVIACLGLLVLLVFLFWKKPGPTLSEDHARTRTPAAVEKSAQAPAPRKAKEAAEKTPPVPEISGVITDFVGEPASTATVRLKPGQTLASRYFKSAGGGAAMWLVTPEKSAEGKVRLHTRLVEFTDQTIESLTLRGFIPDSLFAKNGYAAVDPAELKLYLEAIEPFGGAVSMSIPLVPQPQGPVSTGYLVPGTERVIFSINPRALPEDGGMDLDLNFTREPTTER